MNARWVVVLMAVGFPVVTTPALETDQFYAWTRSLSDASDAINARINADIDDALARVNAGQDRDSCPCRVVHDAIRDRFAYLLIGRPELWATKTSLVSRVPDTPEDGLRYRRVFLFGETSPLDPIRWMPPSPTIEIAGVRVGLDKLTHFFSDGAWIEKSYRRALKKGAADEEAVNQAMRFSIYTELTILGRSTSGVFSLADLEANYQGLLFYRGLCGGPRPALTLTPTGWRLDRPFDMRDYVSPEWDESWQPNIYTRSRWAKVRPVMERYCGLLRDPEIRRRRADYAARDTETPSEAIVRRLVAAGKLLDPRQFTIESACGAAPSEEPRDSSR